MNKQKQNQSVKINRMKKKLYNSIRGHVGTVVSIPNGPLGKKDTITTLQAHVTLDKHYVTLDLHYLA